MIVVDTSAVIDALVGRPPSEELVERLSTAELHAPHLIDVEVLSVLRRLESARHISTDRATDARTDYGRLLIKRYPHQALLDRIWELRSNLTAYDAAFVALSEILGVPLVTLDARLAQAPGHDADVEVYHAK